MMMIGIKRLMLLSLTAMILFSAGKVHADDDDDDQTEAEVTIEDEDRPAYKSPETSVPVHFAENFDDEERFRRVWIKSEAKKKDSEGDEGVYDGIWSLEQPKRNAEEGNLGLVLKSRARLAAISSVLNKTFHFENKPLIIQYEVIFQEEQECGGAYLKLLSLDPNHQDLKKFHDKTPYSIMFGPDKCGSDTTLHFIFRHKNPLNGSIEEKHCKQPREKFQDIFKDKQPHLFTLILKPNNMFIVKIDNNVVNEGSLLDDFTPPVNPRLEIEDPDDKRPTDWDDREKIPDPSAVKPDDWDEDAPAQIVDEDDVMPKGWLEDELPTVKNPEAIKPEDWDNEMDGEWEPPEITNPKCVDVPGCGPYKKKMKNNPRYKGKWLPPLINNPNYKGKWKPKLIHNPDYFNDENPFKMAPIYAVGFELWTISPDIYFDNILITDSEAIAQKWAEDSFETRRKRIADENWNVWYTIAKFTAERPWMWAIYIIALAIPILLIFYCCCFVNEDKEEVKEVEEDIQKEVEINQDEVVWSDNKSEPKQEETANKVEKDAEPEPEVENDIEVEAESDAEEEEEENEEETTTLMTSEKETPSVEKEGPRRRRPNKE